MLTIFSTYCNRQFMMYVIVGVIANSFDLLGYWLLVNYFSQSYITASAVSSALSVIVNFSMHKLLTFNQPQTDVRQILSYIALIAFNYGISLILLFVLIDGWGVEYLFAKALTIITIVLYNFLALKFLVFVGEQRPPLVEKGQQ